MTDDPRQVAWRERPYASRECPYCGVTLDPLPKAKKRCPACGQSIYVRSGPDGLRYLLQELDLPTLAEAWAEHDRDEEWRRRARELTDAADVERTEAQLRVTRPDLPVQEVFWVIANRVVKDYVDREDWFAAKMAFFRMALAAYGEVEDEMDAGESFEADLETVRGLMRQSNRAALQEIAANGSTRASSLPDCDECSDDVGGSREIAAELPDPVLPHVRCGDGFCRCEYLPDID